MLTPLTDEYQEANLAMKLIKDKNYFRSEGGSEGLRGLWPEALEPLSNRDLTASALGALVAHLTRIKVRISPHTNAFLMVSLCVLPIFGLHNLPSYYLRFSLLSYHQRFTEWHNCWGQVNEELLPNGVILSYEVFRGSLRLDGQSIANLELLENKDDGGRAGQTLFSSF